VGILTKERRKNILMVGHLFGLEGEERRKEEK